MITFLSHKDCILINDLDLLLEVTKIKYLKLSCFTKYDKKNFKNVNKISQLDFGTQLELTKSYLDLCKLVFLSSNVKFTIEKVSYLPSKS